MVIMLIKRIGIFFILFSILGFLLFAAITSSAAWNYPVSAINPFAVTSQYNIPSQIINTLYPSPYISSSPDYNRSAYSVTRSAQPNNSFQDMSLFNLFNNISYPSGYDPLGIIPQGFGIYSSGLIGAFTDPYTLLSPWPAMPISYPYGISPTVISDPTYSIGFNPYYTGTTQNSNVRYKVVLIEHEEGNDPVYYLMPHDASCPCPEYAKTYGIPCSIVDGTTYFYGEKTFYKFSMLPNSYGYMPGPYGGYMPGLFGYMGSPYGYMVDPFGYMMGSFGSFIAEMSQPPIQ
ncbi:MAG: hypothetical protein ACMUIU_15155 [bacterium]